MSSYKVIAFPGQELPANYRGLIYSSWLRSLRHGNDYYKLIDPASYYSAYQRYIGWLLSLPDTVVRIAVLTDDHDVALGYSFYRGKILDYVYVNKDMRRRGIGTNLLPKDIAFITHLTRTAIRIRGSKYGHWKFDPFG